MKIVFMNGGLGNQLFQYIFLRWLEINSGEDCVIDDSPFFGAAVPHNGYELERIFGIRHQRLSTYFDPEVWDCMVQQRRGVDGIEQLLRDNGLLFSFVYDTKNYFYDGPALDIQTLGFKCIPTGNTYYHGYWLGDFYFRDIAEILRKELVFPKFREIRNLNYQAQIRQSNSVCIHIRRGDMAALGLSSGPVYFSQAVSYMEQKIQQAKYFLFSDDLSWCCRHWKDLGLEPLGSRVVAVEGNCGQQAYADLQLMIQCRHFISDRSSFSLLASLLNITSPHKIVYSRWH